MEDKQASVIRKLINLSEDAMNGSIDGGHQVEVRKKRYKPFLKGDTEVDVTFLMPNLPVGENLNMLFERFKSKFEKQKKGRICPWNAMVEVVEQRLIVNISYPGTFRLLFNLIALEGAEQWPAHESIKFTNMGLKSYAGLRNFISRTPVLAALIDDMMMKKLVKVKDVNSQHESNILFGIMQRFANLPEAGEEEVDSQGIQLNFGPEGNRQVAQLAQAILGNPNLLMDGLNP